MSEQFEQKPSMDLEGVKPLTPEKDRPIKIWGGSNRSRKTQSEKLPVFSSCF